MLERLFVIQLYQTIDRLLTVFKKSQINILYYDNLCIDPEAFINKILYILNISSIPITTSKLTSYINKSPAFEFPESVYKEVQSMCQTILKELQNILPDLPEAWLRHGNI